ncbi:hypothetical protein A2U01_0074630, partial [Trifolium medium]|nr:hypothetical protein [Trifolium medium]
MLGESSTDLDSFYRILAKWNDLKVSIWDVAIDLLSSWVFVILLFFLVLFFGEPSIKVDKIGSPDGVHCGHLLLSFLFLR